MRSWTADPYETRNGAASLGLDTAFRASHFRSEHPASIHLTKGEPCNSIKCIQSTKIWEAPSGGCVGSEPKPGVVGLSSVANPLIARPAATFSGFALERRTSRAEAPARLRRRVPRFILAFTIAAAPIPRHGRVARRVRGIAVACGQPDPVHDERGERSALLQRRRASRESRARALYRQRRALEIGRSVAKRRRPLPGLSRERRETRVNATATQEMETS